MTAVPRWIEAPDATTLADQRVLLHGISWGSGSATSIAAGFASTCAVLSNGAVVCWGAGTLVGSPVNVLTPTATPDW